MTREELAREIYGFLDYHNVFSEEAYKFNIKVRSIDLPEDLLGYISQDAIDDIVQYIMQDALTEHAKDLQRRFPWIRAWVQAGRLGGWLVVAPHNPVLVIGHRPDGVAVPEVEPEDLQAARKRLRDLKKIEALTRKEIRALVADLESEDFWVEQVPEYKPRPQGRKYWYPRHKSY